MRRTHRRVLELAKQMGYEIVKTYKDEARKPSERRGWKRLLADAESGKANWEVVLCHNHSRISRLDSFEQALAMQVLRDTGKRVHCAVEGILEWTTSKGRILETLGTTDSHDCLKAKKLDRDAVVRQQDVVARQIDAEKLPWSQKVARWQERTGQSETTFRRVLRRVRRLDEIVRWMFERFAVKTISQRMIARRLNARKIAVPHGGSSSGSIM